MIDHRRTGIAELAGDRDVLRPGLHARELDAVRGADQLGAVQQLEEVELPPGAAKLAVGRELQADLFLLLDDLFNFLILDRFQRGGIDLALLAFDARFFQRCGTQDRADMIGAEGCGGVVHFNLSLFFIPPLKGEGRPTEQGEGGRGGVILKQTPTRLAAPLFATLPLQGEG